MPVWGSLSASLPGQAMPNSPDLCWGSGHAGSAPAHTLGVDTARSGITRDLHGCSLTWFEPVSVAGFASVQLSWFCFVAVIVFNSNAAQHKEEVASFLSSQHWLSKATIPLAWIPNCLACPLSTFLFLSRSLPRGSPKQNFPVPQRV